VICDIERIRAFSEIIRISPEPLCKRTRLVLPPPPPHLEMTGTYQMGKANVWRNPYRSYLPHTREKTFSRKLSSLTRAHRVCRHVVLGYPPCGSSISIWRGGFYIRPIEFGTFLLGVKTQTEGCAVNFRFCLSPSLDLVSDFIDPPETAQRGPKHLSNTSKKKKKGNCCPVRIHRTSHS